MLRLTENIKQKQIEEAKASLEGFRETKKNIQNRIGHYTDLINKELITSEDVQIVSKHTSNIISSFFPTYQLISSTLHLLPKIVGFSYTTGGEEGGKNAEKAADFFKSGSDIPKNIAESAGLIADFQRREEEWKFQLKLAQKELDQINQQILAAKIRQDIAEKDLETHTESVTQAEEIYEFYNQKFTKLGLYQYLSTTLTRLYREAFQLAQNMAMQAERALGLELLGDPGAFAFQYIRMDNWSPANKGLLAGERLLLQLHQLERAYLEQNEREQEITLSCPLSMINPNHLLDLCKEGSCQFTVPELWFDLYYPGQYNRRIKSLRLSIPAVVGPYANVSARLRLLGSEIRFMRDGVIESSSTPVNIGKNTLISTSTASNDAGLFELNFQDERYLPFEGAGAVNSVWHLELPKPGITRMFDYNTISDVIVHISYTAKDGGDDFKAEVEANLIRQLKSISESQGLILVRLISLRHEFPNSYTKLFTPDTNGVFSTDFQLERKHFPFFTGKMNLRFNSEDEITILPKLKNGQYLDSLPPNLVITRPDNTPLGGWSIDTGTTALDQEELDDFLVIIRYTIEI